MNQSILFNEEAVWLAERAGWQLTVMTGQGLITAVVSLSWLEAKAGVALSQTAQREQAWADWRWQAEEAIEQALTDQQFHASGEIRL